MIRITYVTVTYNAAAVIGPTLDSVLAQDYPEITHLIIDGASTDATLQMVGDYVQRSNAADNGHRIQVTSEPDHGIYDAMNKGLRSLDGDADDYVCFLNAGDFLPTADTASRIAKAAGNAGGSPAVESESADETPACPAVLYGDTDIVDGEGRFLRHRRLQPPKDNSLTWRSFRQGMLVCHQAFYVRTDFAVVTPYDLRYRYSADVDWCIRVMRAADKEGVALKNLRRVVVNYREEGQTTLHHRASLKERYRVMERHYGRVQTFLLHCWFVLRAVISR